MASLTVALDTIAYARNAGNGVDPDPSQAALVAELYGADGILLQYRRDKKFIREKDLFLAKGLIKSKLIVEMPPIEDCVALAMELKPALVLFVADHADSESPVTTLNFANQPVSFEPLVNQLQGVGVKTGFFVEPEPDEVKGALKTGADSVMISSRGYVNSRTLDEARSEIDKLERAVQQAGKQQAEIYLSGGLDYRNISPFIGWELVDEFIIGHAVCTRAMLVGFEKAVAQMKAILTG